MCRKSIAILIAVILCGGCSAAGKWQSRGVPSRRDAGLLLESQGPSALLRDSRPEGAPLVPVRKKLRPCCAFGARLSVDISFIKVPGYRIDNIIGPEDLGPHRYDSGMIVLEVDRGEGYSPNEHNGLIYTCRGGFIDTAHVRDNVDWTMFLSAAIGADLHRGKTIALPDEGGTRRFVLRALPSELIGEYGLRELFSGFAQWAAFQLSVWHEIATWHGWSSWDAFPERGSAFSPEDLYSNLLGIKLIDGIIADKTGRTETLYNHSVDVWLHEVLSHLGAVSKQTGEHAMHSVDKHWWNSEERITSPDLVIRRNMDIGENLSPWQIPSRWASAPLRDGLERECRGGQEPQRLPIDDHLGQVAFSDWLTLEIAIGSELREREPFRSMGPVITQHDFAQLIEEIRRETLQEFGPQADRPD